jgi:dTDP-glucose 4,6-dehydratase
LECIIARPFAFVGPHLPLDQGFAIGDFLCAALSRQPLIIRGDPRTMRSYLYAAELALWLWTILFRGAPLRPYNVGSDKAISIGELAAEISSLVSPALPVHILSSVQSVGPRSQYVPAVQRCAEELGLRQSVTLREAIRRTAAWHGWHDLGSSNHEGALH